MYVDLGNIGLNRRIRDGKTSLAKEDVPANMWKHGAVATGNKEDQIIYKASAYIRRGGHAPCPVPSDCHQCFFGSPCSGNENAKRHVILNHLYKGGTITWTP